MFFAWQKLTDARGAKCGLCSIDELQRVSGLEIDRIQRAEERPSALSVFFSSAIAVLCLIAVVAVAALWIGSYTLIGFIGVVILGLYIGVDVFIVGFFEVVRGLFYRYSWRNKGTAINAITRAGYCPSCLYALSGLPIEQDGCTVCPECVAAWRLGNGDSASIETAAGD